MQEQQSQKRYVTVKVWSGGKNEPYADILERDADEYVLKVHGEDTYYVPHDEHELLAEDMENHGRYAFMVEDLNQPVALYVETNDSYHSPVEGFEVGDAIERGLVYAPEGHPRHSEEPFQVEMWGRIRMRVEVEVE